MPISEYFAFLTQVFGLIPFTLFDYLFFFLAALFIFEDASFGLIASLSHFVSIAVSIFVSLLFYSALASLLINLFSSPKGFADAISFLSLFIIIFAIATVVSVNLGRKLKDFSIPPKIDFAGGALFGTISFLLIAASVAALALSFPLWPEIKKFITRSVTSKILFTKIQPFETSVRTVFGGAITNTLNFSTIEPGSQETIPLNFNIAKPLSDKESEIEMLILLNNYRREKGLSSLILDEALVSLAQVHAKEMLVGGYFSHYNPNSFSPFDRLEAARIFYITAGENLALAPTAEIAMDGLLKSSGHRKNILSPEFRKVGIGVMDAGVYGKMFVQEFTD